MNILVDKLDKFIKDKYKDRNEFFDNNIETQVRILRDEKIYEETVSQVEEGSQG